LADFKSDFRWELFAVNGRGWKIYMQQEGGNSFKKKKKFIIETIYF
jgi:hypothetical protein